MVDEETMDKLIGLSKPSVKEETIAAFVESCYVSLKCNMCGTILWHETKEKLAEYAFGAGWRFQALIKPETGEKLSGERVLCQYCKDGKR